MSTASLTIPTTGFCESWRHYPAENGPLYEGDEHGQLVADLYRETVHTKWSGGEKISETSKFVKTGRRAVAMPPVAERG